MTLWPGVVNSTFPPAPVLSLQSVSDTSIVYRISNYRADHSYEVTVSPAATASRSGDTITVTGVSSTTTYSVTATASAGGTASPPTVSAQRTRPPVASFSQAVITGSSVYVTIVGYNSAAYTYYVYASSGTLSVNGAQILVSGLTSGQSTTITVDTVADLGTSDETTSQASITETTPTSISVEYMVVAGGGGGGAYIASPSAPGYGGAGGVATSTLTATLGVPLAVTVGAGGAVSGAGTGSQLSNINTSPGQPGGGANLRSWGAGGSSGNGYAGGNGQYTFIAVYNSRNRTTNYSETSSIGGGGGGSAGAGGLGNGGAGTTWSVDGGVRSSGGPVGAGTGNGGYQGSGGSSGGVLMRVPAWAVVNSNAGVSKTESVSGNNKIVTVVAAGANDTITFV